MVLISNLTVQWSLPRRATGVLPGLDRRGNDTNLWQPSTGAENAAPLDVGRRCGGVYEVLLGDYAAGLRGGISLPLCIARQVRVVDHLSKLLPDVATNITISLFS